MWARAATSTPSSFVPIPPCRLFDTRPGADNIGPRNTPLGPADTHTQQVTGNNGNCTSIPATATAVALNVTTTDGSAASFLTVYPADLATRPTASNLNWTPGAPPTPNKVDVQLSPTGQLNFYNHTGTINIITDIVGYYQPTTAGPAGATGPAGPQYGRTTILTRTVDTTNTTGYFTSIAVGPDGNPIISFRDATAGDLKVAACNNPTCTTATITPIDTTNNTGQYTSITIGTNGNPIISYQDDTNDDLKVAACNNPTCTTATITPIDTTNTTGQYTSITIGTNGNPIISYRDGTGGDLKVAACNNPTCTTATITPIDTTNNTGYYTSITIGTNGNPIISYHDGTNGDLKVAVISRTSWTPNNWDS
jgi:hypothetical protein